MLLLLLVVYALSLSGALARSVERVIVRPGALTDREKKGVRREGRGVGNLLWTVKIARADVAGFMLDQLTSDTDLRMAPGVSG